MTAEDLKSYHGKPIHPFLITHWDGKKDTYFRGKNCVKEFIKFFLNRNFRSPHIMFAHNGGKFDFLPIFHYIGNALPEYKRKPQMQHARVMVLKIYKNNHLWQLRDSFSLLQGSLLNLTKGFGVPHVKMEMPTDENGEQIPYDEAPDDWDAYCINDCKGLYDLLMVFNEVMTEVNGSIGCSIASTAMATWRRSYFKYNIMTYFPYNHLFRNAFYGGRTEIFDQYARKDDAPFFDYDVNSMYPAVMRDNLFPISYPTSVKYTDPNDVRGRLGIMECKIEAPYLHIPFLPCHFNKKLLFPVGQWQGFYDFCEIEKALDLGYKITPLRTWEFEGASIFRDFIDTFYPLKQQNKGNAKGEIAKLLQNSLFGKTGERDEQKKLVEGGDYLGLRPFDFIYGYATKTEMRYSPYHVPAVALHVTALARIKLYEIFEKILAQNGIVIYSDTDSVMTNIRLPTSTELGDIKLEHTFQRGIFLQPKLYIFEPYEYHYDKEGIKKIDYCACKGFSRQFKEHLTFDMLHHALTTGDFSRLQENIVRPASLRESSIRKVGEWCSIVQCRSVQNRYDKRIVNKNYTTRPLTMPLKEKEKVIEKNVQTWFQRLDLTEEDDHWFDGQQ